MTAQFAEQPPTARLGAQIAFAQAHDVGTLLDADEAQNTRFPLAADDEPTIERPIIERVAAAFPPNARAGEEIAHLGKERGLAMGRAHLDEFIA